VGQPWVATCASTAGNPGGIDPRVPDRCVNTGFNVWGEWDVPSNSCCIQTGASFCSPGASPQLKTCLMECPGGVYRWEICGFCR